MNIRKFRGHVNRLDVGRTNFRRLVREVAPLQTSLPLVHNTDSYGLRCILDDGSINPTFCNTFIGEALIYLFYGRPSFRPNADEDPTSMKHYAPICLIFKKDLDIGKIKRVYPFDSGAFARGFYSSYIHNRMTLGDFALDTDSNVPGQLVRLFFGTNEAYLSGKPLSPVDIDEQEFEAHSYLGVASAKESNILDSRSSSIEMQISDSIDFSNTIAAIIIPASFIKGRVGGELSKHKIEPLPYRLFDRFKPNEYMSTINDICINYYIRQGFINESELS